MIYKLNPNAIDFPDPRYGEEDGLFAVGGDLSIDRLLLAYSNGIFPWYAFRAEDNSFQDEDGNPWIQWWCPMKRFVIFPEEIHVSHSMRTLLRKNRYVFSVNRAFRQVIHNCGRLRIEECGAWLGPHIEKAYTDLHEQGFAASIEVWDTQWKDCDFTNKEEEYFNDNGYRLVGGLYGVCIGNCFIGESMFSLVPSGSKMALIFLARYMQENNMAMIDCQLETSHLKSMGGRYISYEEYMKIVKDC